jgi:hypothetical protein
MRSEIVTRTEWCAYCLRDSIVTVEQLVSVRGEVVASTVLDHAKRKRNAAPAAANQTHPDAADLLRR